MSLAYAHTDFMSLDNTDLRQHHKTEIVKNFSYVCHVILHLMFLHIKCISLPISTTTNHFGNPHYLVLVTHLSHKFM